MRSGPLGGDLQIGAQIADGGTHRDRSGAGPDEPAEFGQVGDALESVAGQTRLQRNGGAAETAAQQAHGGIDSCRRVARRVVPQPLDDRVFGHGLARHKGEDGEQWALSGTPDVRTLTWSRSRSTVIGPISRIRDQHGPGLVGSEPKGARRSTLHTGRKARQPTRQEEARVSAAGARSDAAHRHLRRRDDHRLLAKRARTPARPGARHHRRSHAVADDAEALRVGRVTVQPNGTTSKPEPSNLAEASRCRGPKGLGPGE